MVFIQNICKYKIEVNLKRKRFCKIDEIRMPRLYPYNLKSQGKVKRSHLVHISIRNTFLKKAKLLNKGKNCDDTVDTYNTSRPTIGGER